MTLFEQIAIALVVLVMILVVAFAVFWLFAAALDLWEKK